MTKTYRIEHFTRQGTFIGAEDVVCATTEDAYNIVGNLNAEFGGCRFVRLAQVPPTVTY